MQVHKGIISPPGTTGWGQEEAASPLIKSDVALRGARHHPHVYDRVSRVATGEGGRKPKQESLSREGKKGGRRRHSGELMGLTPREGAEPSLGEDGGAWRELLWRPHLPGGGGGLPVLVWRLPFLSVSGERGNERSRAALPVLQSAAAAAPLPPPPSPRERGRRRSHGEERFRAYLGGGADLKQVQPVRVPVVDYVGQLAPLLFPATAAAAAAARHPPQQPFGAPGATHSPGGPRRAARLLCGVPDGSPKGEGVERSAPRCRPWPARAFAFHEPRLCPSRVGTESVSGCGAGGGKQ